MLSLSFMPACKKKTQRRLQAYGERWPFAAWQIPRSFAHRFTRRTSSRARGSICPHSVSRAALCKGLTAFTEKSIGMESSQMPNDAGAKRVTFGSAPRKADLLNLKPPADTSLSVQALMADFCSFLGSNLPLNDPKRPPSLS